MEEYRIRFPIGDWSDDGHGKCDWFIVKSNMPVEIVREAHFAFKKLYGFDIGDICHNYGESDVSGEIAEFIVKHKLLNDSSDEFEILSKEGEYLNTDCYSNKLDDFKEGCTINILSSETLLKIWVGLLMLAYEGLVLKTEEDNVPTINYYGFDKKNRHLKTPGYGLFN